MAGRQPGRQTDRDSVALLADARFASFPQERAHQLAPEMKPKEIASVLWSFGNIGGGKFPGDATMAALVQRAEAQIGSFSGQAWRRSREADRQTRARARSRGTSLKPIGCAWSYLACRTGYCVPVRQPLAEPSFHSLQARGRSGAAAWPVLMPRCAALYTVRPSIEVPGSVYVGASRAAPAAHR
jgi:hypothetical protein